ncbi:peptide synthetase [Amycolatopsis balhimycina DSM 5908]|uniref:Peptide synthetase n=1 Tax=Amycolatopsis balhimycina DSM 5908 TaxID=1081091 RepID=A0A428W3K0_AMYBA|nr:condensation domain-containing protein [Amycolatopsis balhimycina]RSM37617.1 peptide synthetase [Amycolatopsis balhimycina DSM 5908]
MTAELLPTGVRVATLSSAQERLWLIEQSAPGSPMYSVPLFLRWTEPVDVAALRVALDGLVARHDVLRTTYERRGDQVVQVVAGQHPMPVEVVDDPLSPHEVRQDAVRRCRIGFDLARTPPARCVVWRATGAVLLLIHHIAVDGWSLVPLFEDLAELYRTGRAAAPVDELRYVDYAQWDRQVSADPVVREELRRRADALVAAPGPARLGGARPVAATPEGARPGGQAGFDLDAELVAAAERVAKQTRSTPFVVFLAAYLETLRRWADRTEFVIGTSTVNRPHPALERMAGFFVNTVPMILRCPDGGTFRDLVAANRTEAFASLRHQRLPFDQLVAEVAARGTSRRGLADIVFAYQNFPAPGIDEPLWTTELLPTGTAKADLLLIVEMTTDGARGTNCARGTLEFATDRYPEQLGPRFVADYLAVLDAVLADPDRPLADVRVPNGPLAAPRPPAEPVLAGRGAPPPADVRRTAANLFRTALSTVDGLAVGRIGDDDNFFALGGNSLLAIAMLGDARVAPREFLADPTVTGLARLLTREPAPAAVAEPPADRPLTSAQERMWLQDRMPHLRAAYLVPSIVEFGPGVDTGRLAAAVDRVLAHHPALRSRFRLDRAAKRVVRAEGSAARTTVTDVTGWPRDKLADHVTTGSWTPFALADEAPARAELLVDDDRCVLVFCAHHLVLDGASRQVVFDQIGAAYRGDPLAAADAPAPPPPPADAAELITALAGAPTDIALPHDRPRGARQSIEAGSVRRRLGPARTAQLRKAAADAGCSLFLATTALVAGTLARHTAQRDFVFVFPWSQRPGAATDVVGMFVNTVPIRVDLTGARTWRDALERAAAAGAIGYRGADVPFDEVAAALHPARDLGRPPVTPVYVDATDTTPRPPDLGAAARLWPLPALKAKYEMEFTAVDSGDGLEFDLAYLTGLFDAATAGAVADTLLACATALADDPRSPLAEETR